MKHEPTATGYVLYEGPSQINRAPIVAVATGILRPSENPKTGPMIQVYILVADMHPAEAVKRRYDEAICGDCAGRESCKGWCYVTMNHGVAPVWQQLQAGRYPRVNLARKAPRVFMGRHVRIGAYGDPLSVPLRIWNTVIANAGGVTSYTHQWLTQPQARKYRHFVMASCDNPAEQQEAASKGYSTFRIMRKGEQPLRHERRCASQALGLQCIQCGTCSGTAQGQKFIAATVHGKTANRFNSDN